MVHPQIAAFARLAKENTPPVRTLEGQKTLISRTMHGFGYDAVHDEIVVTGPLTQAILIFRGGANGEEPPLRVIQGPHTRILGTGYGGLDRVSVDGVHGEIYLPISTGQILVFPREANGDVAPKRVLNGARGAITVDPVHDLLIVNGRDSMAIYDRTASGDAKPKAVIQGPQSRVAGLNTVQVLPSKGLVIGGCDRARHPSVTNAVCAWSITDNGNVPPRWAIPIQASTGGYQASGIALDPVHKEIIISAPGEKEDGRPPDGTVNNILTFSWPEIF